MHIKYIFKKLGEAAIRGPLRGHGQKTRPGPPGNKTIFSKGELAAPGLIVLPAEEVEYD